MIFVLFVHAAVLFEGDFSLWVSLTWESLIFKVCLLDVLCTVFYSISVGIQDLENFAFQFSMTVKVADVSNNSPSPNFCHPQKGNSVVSNVKTAVKFFSSRRAGCIKITTFSTFVNLFQALAFCTGDIQLRYHKMTKIWTLPVRSCSISETPHLKALKYLHPPPHPPLTKTVNCVILYFHNHLLHSATTNATNYVPLIWIR